MIDEPLDLSALDPDKNAASAEHFVAAVMERIERRRGLTLSTAILLLAPQTVAAAAIFGLLATGALVMQGRRANAAVPASVAESIGIPRVIALEISTSASHHANDRR